MLYFFELIMGPTCSIVFENEPMEKGLKYQKPRALSTDFFDWRELSVSILQGLIIALSLLFILFFSIKTSPDEKAARTMVFSTLIFSNILLTLTGRSKNYSVLTTIQYKNHLVPLVIIITLAILALAVYYPPLCLTFGFKILTLNNMLISLSTAFVSVLWIELFKLPGKVK